MVDGIFYSSLICERDSVEEILDARTSDAIALALRFDSPIYTYDKILEKAGIILNKEISKKNIKNDLHDDFKKYSKFFTNNAQSIELKNNWVKLHRRLHKVIPLNLKYFLEYF